VGFCEGYAGYADDEVVGAGGAADGGFADCEGEEGGGGGGCWGRCVGGDAVVNGQFVDVCFFGVEGGFWEGLVGLRRGLGGGIGRPFGCGLRL